MALTYDGTGGLFTRLGKLIYTMDLIRTHQSNMKSRMSDVAGAYSSADMYMVSDYMTNAERRIQEMGSMLLDIQAACEKTLVEMCWTEATSSTTKTNTMRTKTLGDALVWLIREMRADSESIDGNTITKSSATFGASNVGAGNSFTYLNKTPNVLLGGMQDWQNVREEAIECRVIQDSVSGGLQPGSEIWSVRGQPAYPGLDYRFPRGSGVNIMIATMCASVDAGCRGQNLLTNSDFEDQTTNLPDQWTVSSGTAGTHFTTETGTYMRGAKSLKLAAGTGGTFSIRQRIGAASGTVGRIVPDRAYLMSFAYKIDVGCTGVVRMCVKDASGNIIDSGGFTQSFTLNGGSTSWVNVVQSFRAPINVPSECYLHFETTTTIATAAAYIDELILAEMTPIGFGGPAIGIVAGSSDLRVDDKLTFYFENNKAGLFAIALDRLFDMYGRGLQLPSNWSGTETIDDALIV